MSEGSKFTWTVVLYFNYNHSYKRLSCIQATSVSPEPLPDTNPTRPSCERQRRTVPLRMKSKGKEAEDIMELRLEDSGIGLSRSLRL